MITLTINAIPASISVPAVVGADVAFTFKAQNPDGTLFDLTDYTVTAEFVSPKAPADLAGLMVAVELTTSVISLSLTGAQTAQLAAAQLNPTAVTYWDWTLWIVKPGDHRPLARGGLVLVPG